MNLHPNDIPSMNNIYDNTYWNKVREDEQKRSNNMYEKASNPFETGVVPNPAYADMFQPINFQQNDYNINTQPKQDIFTSLSGNKMTIDNFTHNNMQPFFKGRVTQNTDLNSSTTRLDYSTGNDKFYQHKKEVECFFKPTQGFGNVCGMKNNDDFYKDRIVSSKLRNNDFPIKSIKVGPGLNKGFNSEGVGGFQQEDAINYAIPKTLDELRSKVNQKNSCFNIPFKAPIKGTDQRGVVTPFSKNRQETSYEQTPEQWIKTTGANLKNTERSEQYIKPTARVETHIDYKGIATDTNIKQREEDNYNKSSILVYNNERQTTQSRTVVSNITSIVKAVIAPVTDALRFTIKEYTIDSARRGGNIRTQIPEKATLYDPDNHVMKTTVKETTIHDSEMMNLSGPDQTYSALEDQAKTTVKETTIHDSEIMNLSGPDETYSALHDQAKTTIKETTIHDTENGNLKGFDGTYTTTDDKMKTTNKETLPTYSSSRNINSHTYRVYVYDPNLAVKTTTKETTIKGKSEYGFIGGIIEKLFGAYIHIPVEMKNTQKQYISDYENYGIAESKEDYRQTSREAEYNAEIDGTREMLLINAGHTPNGSGKYTSLDQSDISMSSKKPIENDMAQRTTGNVGRIYQNAHNVIDKCSVTKPQNLENAYKNVLDPSLLEPLKGNELNININGKF